MLFAHIYYYNDSIYYLQAKGSRNKLEYSYACMALQKEELYMRKKTPLPHFLKKFMIQV